MRNVFPDSALTAAILAGRVSVARSLWRIMQRAALTGLAGTVVTANPLWALSGTLMWIAAAVYRGRMETLLALAGKAAEAAMERRFLTLPSDATLGATHKRVEALAQRFYPIIEGEHVIGVVSAEALFQGLLRKGADVAVTSVMQCEFMTVAASAPLSRVAPRLRIGSAPLLAFSGGRLVGMLTYDSLNQYLKRER